MYEEAGVEMLRTDDILALDKDKRIVSAILTDLSESGQIVKVSPSYYISAEGWQKALEVAMSFDGEFTLADYRDRLGTSRKYASEILPAFDKAGVTVFDGTARTVIKK